MKKKENKKFQKRWTFMFTSEEIELLNRIDIKLNGKKIDIKVINNSTLIINSEKKYEF